MGRVVDARRNRHRGRAGSSFQRRGRPSAAAGFGLVDVAIALFALLMSAGALFGAVQSALKGSQSNEETARATAVAQAVAESLREAPFDQLLALYGPGGRPGFSVRGLTVRTGDADGLAGEVRFPLVQVNGAFELREDVEDTFLGLPRDLNGDGIDALDHSADYELLPVEIRVEWTSAGGPRLVRLGLLLGRDS
jgi:hypothetical protein